MILCEGSPTCMCGPVAEPGMAWWKAVKGMPDARRYTISACPSALSGLSGRIQSDDIPYVESAMRDGCAHKILDLSEVTLVDLGVVRFLISCEDEGIELVQCPPYVREWILRGRAE
jgi:hypothetical protein